MATSAEFKIRLSRTKLILLLVGSIAFVVIGSWFLTIDRSQFHSFGPFGNPVTIWGAGLASVIFFGGCAIVAVKKLFDTRPGLIFSELGLVDNSSGICAGLIPWSEISGVTIYEIQGQKSLIIHVTNPEKYLTIGGPIRRWFTRAAFKMCGSPISISSNALKINFNDLHEMIKTYIARYGVNA